MESLIELRYRVHLHQVEKAVENYRRLKELEARYEKKKPTKASSESLKRLFHAVNEAMKDIQLATHSLEKFEQKILEIDIDDLIYPFIDVKKRKVQKQVLQEMLHTKSVQPIPKPIYPLKPLKNARKANRT